jgi:hypothetical protein
VKVPVWKVGDAGRAVEIALSGSGKSLDGCFCLLRVFIPMCLEEYVGGDEVK